MAPSYGSVSDSHGGFSGSNSQSAGEREPLIISENTAPAGHGPEPTAGLSGLMSRVRAGGKRRRTTNYLTQRHGINTRMMYIEYYVPGLKWMKEYKLSYLKGDFLGAVTIASIYVPLALSLAANLGHIPAVNGLYTFVVALASYAVLGISPTLVAGPEVPCSLLAGQLVLKHSTLDDERRSAEIMGIVTLIGGVVIFLAGLFRLGFLDNVLSRPFLRGFISSIGVVIFIEQVVPMLGLSHVKGSGTGTHGMSAVMKLVFVLRHLSDAHQLTSIVSVSALFILIAFRSIKARLVPRYPSLSFFPDRFLIVVVATVATWAFHLQDKGLEIMGDVKLPGKAFPIRIPTSKEDFQIANDIFGPSCVIALLGFFESSVAGKSLNLMMEEHNAKEKCTHREGERQQKKSKPAVASANRELVALGVCNLLGGIFMTLPAFGGYGRSKVGIQAGAQSGMESFFLAVITALCALYLTPLFYYIPRGVLSAIIADVGLNLLNEVPPDIRFFFRIQGWSELGLMFLIFFTTVFWDLEMGLVVGIGLSVLRVIRHSTRPRIQLLARDLETNAFENAEEAGVLDDGGAACDILDSDDNVSSSIGSLTNRKMQFVVGCLIVKIPEPLIFSNASSLGASLRRFEFHGTSYAHPALPPVLPEGRTRNLILDVHGVTRLDGASVQILREIVADYRSRGIRVFFSRVRRSHQLFDTPPEEDPLGLAPRKKSVWQMFVDSGIAGLVGPESRFVSSVDEALAQIREIESSGRRTGVGVADVGAGPGTRLLRDGGESGVRGSSTGSDERGRRLTRSEWHADDQTVFPRDRVSD